MLFDHGLGEAQINRNSEKFFSGISYLFHVNLLRRVKARKRGGDANIRNIFKMVNE
jgi:hypothetical protein